MYLCVRVSFPSLYQAMKVSGHVFVCLGYRFCLYFYDFDIKFLNCSDSELVVCFSFFYFIYTDIDDSDEDPTDDYDTITDEVFLPRALPSNLIHNHLSSHFILYLYSE
jgi:hypothetical protein